MVSCGQRAPFAHEVANVRGRQTCLGFRVTHQPTPLNYEQRWNTWVIPKCRAVRPIELGPNLGHIKDDVKQMIDCLVTSAHSLRKNCLGGHRLCKALGSITTPAQLQTMRWTFHAHVSMPPCLQHSFYMLISIITMAMSLNKTKKK
jgi:hypothetical protein